MKSALVLIALLTFPAYASAVKCNAVLAGRGYSSLKAYELKPAPQDKHLLIAKKDQFSFAADLVDYQSNGSLRLFIHDNQADITALTDGMLKKNGKFRELTLKHIVGYETTDPLTLILSCYE